MPAIAGPERTLSYVTLPCLCSSPSGSSLPKACLALLTVGFTAQPCLLPLPVSYSHSDTQALTVLLLALKHARSLSFPHMFCITSLLGAFALLVPLSGISSAWIAAARNTQLTCLPVIPPYRASPFLKWGCTPLSQTS